MNNAAIFVAEIVKAFDAVENYFLSICQNIIQEQIGWNDPVISA